MQTPNIDWYQIEQHITYILVNGTVAIARVRADAAARQAYERNREVIFKNLAPFMGCISEIN